MIWFLLCGISRIGKSIETVRGLVVASIGERRIRNHRLLILMFQAARDCVSGVVRLPGPRKH